MDRFEIDPELRANLLEPFISAACLTLHEMTGMEPFPQDSYGMTHCKTLSDISAVLALTSSTVAALVLGFPERTAALIAERILAEFRQDVDDSMMRDCVGEIANVIAGQAKALLHGTPHRFTFATPRIVSGAGQEIRPGERLDCLVVSLGSEMGNSTLQVCRQS